MTHYGDARRSEFLPGKITSLFRALNAIEIQKDSSETTEMRPPSVPLLLSLLLALFWATWNNSTSPIVKLHYGSFRGKVDGDLIQYLGIPFAAPPYAKFFAVFP
jgi:hypothetical protein